MLAIGNPRIRQETRSRGGHKTSVRGHLIAGPIVGDNSHSNYVPNTCNEGLLGNAIIAWIFAPKRADARFQSACNGAFRYPEAVAFSISFPMRAVFAGGIPPGI